MGFIMNFYPLSKLRYLTQLFSVIDGPLRFYIIQSYWKVGVNIPYKFIYNRYMQIGGNRVKGSINGGTTNYKNIFNVFIF